MRAQDALCLCLHIDPTRREPGHAAARDAPLYGRLQPAHVCDGAIRPADIQHRGLLREQPLEDIRVRIVQTHMLRAVRSRRSEPCGTVLARTASQEPTRSHAGTKGENWSDEMPSCGGSASCVTVRRRRWRTPSAAHLDVAVGGDGHGEVGGKAPRKIAGTRLDLYVALTRGHSFPGCESCARQSPLYHCSIV